ncbi:CoA transferase subunit A [Desulfopila aestuarii]|uniref:Acetate CoA/acetoacetate CoA-transferase alpha subunit n=1 Tax=Desulfopila aestuarii DSM 18488 TaxID=1121416 RepID=A0A1M7YCW7_9BACT|nr:CoA transferase subunit A [Desulfopila aestuarii]SHO50358.1 acetate CoA/acetoacetate CoA-transferase alpha subunit [Desulfopila aestuarii DSM 18488]
MIDKTTTVSKALENVTCGMSVMVGGFGVPGTPFLLINGLLGSGADRLILIKNEANEAGLGVSLLLEAGRVSRLITSHLGLNSLAIAMMNKKEIEVNFYPQGILAEKIRAGGAGLLAIVTDIGINTILRREENVVQLDGREGMIEPALRANIALIHAAKADRAGNLVYEKSARNFNPLMATAADLVIAEAEEIVETGEIPPDQVHTPGAFVDHVVPIGELLPEYGVLKHHVR